MTSNAVKRRPQRVANSTGSNLGAARLPSWLDRLRSRLGLGNEAGRPAAAVDQLGRARKLAEALRSERGEASGAVIARELHEVLRNLAAEDRRDFQRFLATGFAPDATVLRAAAEAYLAGPTAEPQRRWRKRPIRPGRNCFDA
jgi:malonyl-CoA decarboxylase